MGQIPAWNPDRLVIYSSRKERKKTTGFFMQHLGHELTVVGEQAFGKLIASGVVKEDFD